MRSAADHQRADKATRNAHEMIRKGGVRRLGWVYGPSWCCRNVPISVTRSIDVTRSGCSHRRPSHLLLSCTLAASPPLARRVLEPMNPRISGVDVTPGPLTRSCRREPVSQCDGNVGGAGGCWVQIEGPDEMWPGDGRSVAERTKATVGRVGWQSKTRRSQPGVEGNEVGLVDMVVRIIWAQLGGIPKKKTMSSLEAEESKSRGAKPVPQVQCRTEDMRGF